MFSTTIMTAEPAAGGQAARWIAGSNDSARALRRLIFSPASYANRGRLPTDLPAAMIEKLAQSPRTARLISAAMLANSSLDLRPTQPSSLTIRLALLEGEVLALLARRLGVTLVSAAFESVIESEVLAAIEAELGADAIGFAREAAPLLRQSEAIAIDWSMSHLAAAIDGAGYRTLQQALYGEPPWVTNRFRFKCPAPLDDRVDLSPLPIESTFAVAIRVARQLPTPWSTSFAPRAS